MAARPIPDPPIDFTPAEVNAARDAAVGADGNPAAVIPAAVMQRELRAIALRLPDPRPGNNPRPGQAAMPTLKETSADGWFAYRRKFRLAAQINNWDDLRQRRQVLLGLEGDALARVQDLEPEPAQAPDPWTIAEFLDLLESRFVHNADTCRARVDFKTALQLHSEDVCSWHTRLKMLHVRAWRNIADRDAAQDLIMSFIWGIRTHAVKVEVIKANPDTYQAALTAAQQAESAVILIKHSQEAFGGKKEHGNHSMNAMDSPTKKVCWTCQQPGHLQRDCPQSRDPNAKGKTDHNNNKVGPPNNGGKARGGRGKGGKGKNDKKVGALEQGGAEEAPESEN